MRLWSLHPSYLDAKGLVACWRETLLAQKVLAGGTQGYTEHPQLVRFKEQAQPLVAMGRYLQGIWDEACARGYNFDKKKILHPPIDKCAVQMTVASGQVDFERAHLLGKLQVRDPGRALILEREQSPVLHPNFTLIPGPIASWEKGLGPEFGQIVP